MRLAGSAWPALPALLAAALLAACETTGGTPEEAAQTPQPGPAPAVAATPAPTQGAPVRSRSLAVAPLGYDFARPQPGSGGQDATSPAPAEAAPADTPPADTPPADAAAAATPADAAPATPEPATAPAAPAAPGPEPAAGPAPHVYLSLQAGTPVSAVFAIDAARDGSPSDDPAIRITPDAGLCNPQEMRRYTFPPADAARPVVTEADQARGLTAVLLPEFMAVAVTERMLAQGLAADREETRPLNICTRKLWERLVAAQTAAALAAGQ